MNITPLPPNSLVCIISARRYGDAIMNARIVKAAAQERPDIKWVIWTKPEFTPLFHLMGFDRIITSEFPIAGGAPKVLRDVGISLIRAIRQLRKLHLDASIDFIGDVRETALGALITGNRHVSPRWDKAHWMRKLIWNTHIPSVNYLKIPAKCDQIYEIASNLLSALIKKKIILTNLCPTFRNPIKIAFHPFSSQVFKNWPDRRWCELSFLLSGIAITPLVFCTESEEIKARRIFAARNNLIEIKPTKSLEDLIDKLQSIDLLVGVDSFLVHLASALGKKTIVINAGNLPNWWQPPNSQVIGQSGGCLSYPCSNKPNCIGGPGESQCIKSIQAEQIMNAIKTQPIESFKS